MKSTRIKNQFMITNHCGQCDNPITLESRAMLRRVTDSSTGLIFCSGSCSGKYGAGLRLATQTLGEWHRAMNLELNLDIVAVFDPSMSSVNERGYLETHCIYSAKPL